MLSEKEMKVLRLIDDHQGELIEYLRKLISFKTVTPASGGKAEGDDYKEFQDFVYKTLQEMGFTLDMWEVEASTLENFPGSGVDPERDLSNMPVVVGELKGSGKGKSLILNGHYDVVPVGVIENWSHDPFKGEIEDNKIYGRGACDMKGGIATMIEAVKFIQRAGIKLAGDLIVQTVPDEEKSCMGTLACCQKGYKADAAIIPEFTDMNVLIAMRGGTGGKITVFGRSGHAEMTQPHWREGGAVNAISKAVKVIQALEQLTEEWRTRPDKRHKFLDPDIITPTLIKGGEWSVMYPEKVEITFDSMFIPSMVNISKEIKDKIMSVAATDPWMKEHSPKIEIGGGIYGAEINENEPIIKTAVETSRELGLEPKLIGYGSLTDAVHLINYSRIPTISIGVDGHTAHKADEFVDVGQLVKATKVMALSILRWCEYS